MDNNRDNTNSNNNNDSVERKVDERKCEKCGSKYELHEHHTAKDGLPRTHPEKSKETKTLCATCHYEEHSEEWTKLTARAKEREYNETMSKWEKRWREQDADKKQTKRA